MDNNIITKIKDSLQNTINPKRYLHTMGVVDASIILAQKYDGDIFHATVAALLHDYAKDFSRQQLMDYINTHNLSVDPIMLEAYQLLHGKVAASIAEKKFHIDNIDILNAIKHHTTGRKNMSKLEKIIYLADFIEKGRNYPGVEELRKIAEEDLDKAVLRALNNTIVYVLSIEKLLHPNTLHARNEMLLKFEK
ncbi:bis(5'-nucleosyl)-tetraphosphatase (symmetrical) YqeK [Natronincola ferrireducens]|uniref:bis(5'-nucleosyl)-tetraphosphatase (symmetrical) n=1 Tax=Natronincola ferrireducens TaxID=393762 RepID=A0A1G9D185_9FIRM|nr:bis(5'-nucleosyl)-tetraphosphatase (symmetrical) YqeK [Natronincola ferrireducens]SDK57464.1 putative HD superfamily hydrolase of NAD metabolism [Natronincola ferrireducens]